MPGWRTYNITNQPVWVTIYTLGGVFQEDWGNVDPGTYRDWHSGHYAIGSYYKVRGQWPTEGTKFDTDTTRALNSSLRQLALLGGDSGVYWTDLIVRTDIAIAYPVWITIYSQPGDEKRDWGPVDPGSYRDWTGGGVYSDGLSITVLAEWDSSITKLDRTSPQAPPSKTHSAKINRMFGNKGLAHVRLDPDGAGGGTWVNVN